MVVTLQELLYLSLLSNPIPDPLPNFNELDLPWQRTTLTMVMVTRNGKTDNNTNAGLTASETYNLEVY